MTPRFLHIGFKWEGDSKVAELKPIFDKAKDWYRYAPNCWIVWTTSEPQKWFERLKPHLGPNDNMFICALDASVRGGWMPKSAWDWLAKTRDSTAE